jgi:hypothetical protein
VRELGSGPKYGTLPGKLLRIHTLGVRFFIGPVLGVVFVWCIEGEKKKMTSAQT